MQRPPEDASELDRLKAEVRELERRLAFVERLQNIAAPEPITAGGGGADAPLLALPDAVPVGGRAILGLAGAYLLRAVAEAALVPRLAVLAIAIAWSVMWLWLAARGRRAAAIERETPGRRAAPFVYGVTAALIFSPLLWEATVRFHLLPHLVAGALLVGLPALAGKLRVAGLATVLASSTTALALMIQTGDLLPFAVAIIAVAAVEQVAGKPWPRAVSASAASLSIFLLAWIELRPGGPVGDYAPVSGMAVALCACALPLIAVAGLVKRRGIAPLEVPALGLALTAMVWGAPAWASGAILLAFCTGCVYLLKLDNRAAFQGMAIVEIFVLPLALAGSFLLFPYAAAVVAWYAAAVAVTRAAARRRSHVLEFQGVALLASAALLSGFAEFAARAFTTSHAGPPVLAVALMALSAALAWHYATWTVWPRLVFAVLAIVASGTLLLELSHAGPALLPAFQTLYLCGAALSARYAAARTDRVELSWIGFGLLAVGGLKLLMVDFRESRPEMLAVSLVCYGSALILVSRLKRRP